MGMTKMYGTYHPSAVPAWLTKKPKGEVETRTWSTPPHITKAILAGFNYDKFSLDPTSPKVPTVPCHRFFTIDDDGLSQPWHGRLVFLNPPYVDFHKWVNKAIREYQIQRAEKMVLLLPARFENAGINKLNAAGAAMFLLTRRLKFGNSSVPAPWASLIHTLGATEEEIARLRTKLPKHQRIRFD
jgi:hypothetical protein